MFFLNIGRNYQAGFAQNRNESALENQPTNGPYTLEKKPMFGVIIFAETMFISNQFWGA